MDNGVKYAVEALQCDVCTTHNPKSAAGAVAADAVAADAVAAEGACTESETCVWVPSNTEIGGSCMNKCRARNTKGECDQYHEWNKSELSPVIYDFSGADNNCMWYPNEYSIDDTYNSREGVCRAKDSPCFDTNDLTTSSVFTSASEGQVCTEGEHININDDNYCYTGAINSLGEVYCGYYYSGHDNGCFNYDNTNCVSNSDDKCKLYTDPRIYEFKDVDSINKGYCVSDNQIQFDLETGEELGLIKTDEECGLIKESENCINELGNGCLWEPIKQYCVPVDPNGTLNDMYSSCKPIDGHLYGNYDLNLLEEEGINVSEYRDRDNKKYPYYTSKYLCDVCSIRDNDLDNMYELEQLATIDSSAPQGSSAPQEAALNTLNYYMIKNYVEFPNGANVNRSSTAIPITPKQYCEKEIDDKYDIFNPCILTDDETSSKGTKCISKCSQNSPIDNSIVNSLELKNHKDQCVSDKWYPEESIRNIPFPNLFRGSETTDDYFKDRYCSWDGFECHNSIPCKFAQQTRCEDLGYDWYEGTALDIMTQNPDIGIPLDLSSSYPIVRKGDGKPVEGDMEGVCIYPNVEAAFIGQPAEYIINPKYVGEQVIMIKWREYGSGWWEDMSCKRKIKTGTDTTLYDMAQETLNNNSYFLGENIALIPFKIEQGDKCSDIMEAINNALQSYQYFVYNGEWVMYAEDLVQAIEHSYDSSINEADVVGTDRNNVIYTKYYGYLYYTGYDMTTTPLVEPAIDDDNRKILNAIYDLRGAINILPVIKGKCALQIKTFTIDDKSGVMSLTVEPIDNVKFEFVEFIGTEVFSDPAANEPAANDSKLTLTVLSKYDYSQLPTVNSPPTQVGLPYSIVEGYGTLYENKNVKDIEPSSILVNDILANDNMYDIRKVTDFNALQTEIRRYVSSGQSSGQSSEYTYTPSELENWAAYVEFKNFNVFSQPIIGIKRELNKAKCKNSAGEVRLCSGSLESWKIHNTPPIPRYQAVSLLKLNGLLKMMAKYVEAITNPGVLNGEDVATYRASYQQTDITKCVLWSITRNTPPFWGNLFYNRNKITADNSGYTDLYGCCGNFNKITETNSGDAYNNQVNGVNDFKYSIADNTLIKPFCEIGNKSAQKINWKNIMSYTGGNKREIQLSRNVRNMDYNDYSLAAVAASTAASDAISPRSIGDNYYMCVSYDDLYQGIIAVPDTTLQDAKKEYIYRSLSDWLRLDYEPLHGRCQSNTVEGTVVTTYGPRIALSGGRQWSGGQRHSEDIGVRGSLLSGCGGGRGADTCTGDQLTNPFISRWLSHIFDDYRDSDSVTQYNNLNKSTTDGTVNLWDANASSTSSAIDRLVIDHNKKDMSIGNWSGTRSYCTSSSGTPFNDAKGFLIGVSGTACPPEKPRCRGTLPTYDGIQEKTVGNAAGNLPSIPYQGTPGYQHWSYTSANNTFNPHYTTDTGSTYKDMETGHTCDAAYDYESYTTDDDPIGINNFINAVYASFEDAEEADIDTDDRYRWSALYGTWADIATGGNVSGVDLCCGAWLKPDCTTRLKTDSYNLPGYGLNGSAFGPTIYTKRKHLFPGVSVTGASTADRDRPNLDSPDLLWNDTNHTILSLHRLSRTPISDHNDILQDPQANNDWKPDEISLLYPWGKKKDDEEQMWTDFVADFGTNDHDDMINKLYYPIDLVTLSLTTNIISPLSPRPAEDQLRAWCMSNCDSLDPTTFNPTSPFNILNHINPDNFENQVGIIQDGSVLKLDNYIELNKIGPLTTTEFFDMEKETNAYKYPAICEPWYLKNRDSPADSDDTPVSHGLARYDYSMHTWNNTNYNPLDPNAVFVSDFGTLTIGTGTVPDTTNTLLNMIYPLSITAARPREKKIYIDITPNNNVFLSNNDEINITYFDQDNYSYLYNDTTYFLKPGISIDDYIVGTNSDMGVSTVETEGEDIVYSQSPSPGYIANHHVSYFKYTHDLLATGGTFGQADPSDQFIIRTPSTPTTSSSSTSVLYKFNWDKLYPTGPAQTADQTTPPTLLSITTSDSPLTSMKYNNYDTFYNLPVGETLFGIEYYEHRLPQQSPRTFSIKNNLFGTGYGTKAHKYTGSPKLYIYDYNLSLAENEAKPEAQVAIAATTAGRASRISSGSEQYYLTSFYGMVEPDLGDVYDFYGPTSDPPKYLNINMIFDEVNNDQRSVINKDQSDVCKDIIRSKLSTCGSPNNWTNLSKVGCQACFDFSLEESGLCADLTQYIEGSSASQDSGVSQDSAMHKGVCGILYDNDHNDTPWDYIDITREPENYGINLPPISPYSDNKKCDNVISDIDFIPLYHAGSDPYVYGHDMAFFKNVRSDVSDIFIEPITDNMPYGCMRQDLSLINNDNLKINCNTDITDINRDKHVLINFIIEHSDLNASKRTKLAIMSDEELLNKALDLNIDIALINEYTRPKVHKTVRDIKINNVCEKSGKYCLNDDNCETLEKCGRYEEWNDLQKYYYNIDASNKKDFTMRKEWSMIGCGLDLNYSDSSSGESVCKDKYPGLCENNIDKCSSDNNDIREAIMLDCPETCQVQYTDFDRYKTEQIGELSICTARGRCKWSHDSDPSNLLPLCEDHTTRDTGSVEKCNNYNLPPSQGGPDAGTCNLDNYSNTLYSPVCAEQRCTSMQGCVFTKQLARYCKVDSYVDDRIVNEVDCPGGSRWIGASTGGQCIMPFKNFYDSDLQDFEQDCSILGGTIIDGQEQSCEYVPDLPYTGEDPCSHTIDLDDLTDDEMAQYFYSTVQGVGVYVTKITPEKLNGESNTHPQYIKITLSARLNTSNISNFDVLSSDANLSEYPADKYIFIDNNTSDNNSICSQYLLGKSKIVKIINTGDGTDPTEIIIGGPNKAYILPRYTDEVDGHELGDIDIGGTNACEFKGIYDIDAYYVNSTDDTDNDTSPDKRKANACYKNSRGACNYEKSGDCVSCALYNDEFSCFGNNDPDEFSRCGWGSIKDMCGVIGEMNECKLKHLDGCEWDPAKEICSLNKLTDTDGNPLVDKVGCVKCDDISHKNTCNSIKNCFWDNLTATTTGIGTCRACSSIADPDSDINVDEVVGTEKKCNEFQLTEGQCEFRKPANKVSGLSSDLNLFSETGRDSISDQIKKSWEIIGNDLLGHTGTDSTADDLDECAGNDECKCSPTRLYPFFPDWIIHNLIFMLIFGPFVLYFGYAFWKVVISPGVFEDKLIKVGDKIGLFSKNKAARSLKAVKESYTGKFSWPWSSPDIDWSHKKNFGVVKKGGASDAEIGSIKFGDRWKDLAGTKFQPIEELRKIFTNTSWNTEIDGVPMTYDNKGFFGGIIDIYTHKDISKHITNGLLNPILGITDWKANIKLQFNNLMPATNKDTELWCSPALDTRNIINWWEYLKYVPYAPFLFLNPIWFLKIAFMLISFPFTILQLLTHNVRLSIPKRLAGISTWVAGLVVKAGQAVFKVPAIGWFLAILAYLIAGLLYIGAIVVFVGSAYKGVQYGIKLLLELTKTGISPNTNYVDPVDGVTHKINNKFYQASAIWPKKLYREEWDDMITDPISDAVIQQRETLLPNILQADVNEGGVTDAYNIAYMVVEPESLNWTQRLRNIGTFYNKVVNRIGDDLIFGLIIGPYIVYKYLEYVSNLLRDGDSPANKLIIKIFLATILLGVTFGLLSIIMSRSDPIAGEYDGVETKCYGDVPIPITNPDGHAYNYPKLCYGDSLDVDKDECPYGCYYTGIGAEQGNKCKDNRSALSLDPEPRLKLPYTSYTDHPEDWLISDEPGKQYVCPPQSRFLGKYPYDALCSTTAKRCKAKYSLVDPSFNLIINGDDYCEALYVNSNYSDETCNNSATFISDLNSLAGGPITDGNQTPNVKCEIHTPYEGYAKDILCPFPLPSAENDFYSEETNTRSSIELLNLAYDKITNKDKDETCTYICADPSNCTLDENSHSEYCNDVDMYNLPGTSPEDVCKNASSHSLPCQYYPENIPLQQSIQNQERYYIVNQEYGGNLFS